VGNCGPFSFKEIMIMAYVPKTAIERAQAELKHQIQERRRKIMVLDAEVIALVQAQNIIEDMEAEYERDIERQQNQPVTS
jgi:hypothetical protein